MIYDILYDIILYDIISPLGAIYFQYLFYKETYLILQGEAHIEFAPMVFIFFPDFFLFNFNLFTFHIHFDQAKTTSTL